MERLTITAHLRTPVAANGYLTFDSLLAALLFEQLKDVDAAHAAVPITCTDGLFHASAMFTAGAGIVPQSTVASLHATREAPAIGALLRKKNDGRTYRMLSRSQRRAGGAVKSDWRYPDTLQVSWDVVGDPNQIDTLLAHANFIGAHRARGWGEVDR